MIHLFGEMMHYNIELSASRTLSVPTQGSPRPTVCSLDTPSQTAKGWKIHAGRQSYGEQYYTHIADRLQIVLRKAIQNRTETHKGNQMHQQREVSVAEASNVHKIVICLLVPKMHKADSRRDFSNCVCRVHLITGGFWLDQSLANQPSLVERKSPREARRRGAEQ